ncbi:hypothetical protein LJC63_09975, partial [Ruminococcaceae bacterium OttesenSCG-928-L11]|nr:hypothetical protein [Ruminococcaceae bacterium OttesenSCG-928-L11]
MAAAGHRAKVVRQTGQDDDRLGWCMHPCPVPFYRCPSLIRSLIAGVKPDEPLAGFLYETPLETFKKVNVRGIVTHEYIHFFAYVSMSV